MPITSPEAEASVSLEILNEAERGANLGLRVTTVLDDSDIEIDHVTVKVRGVEDVSIPDVKVAPKVDEDIETLI